jgi:CheY-like chemotaxis protein
MRVLIIEDEAHIREVAQISLEAVGGWTVILASGGIEGVELARSEQPDAILLDVMMPDVDGPATLERLRALDETSSIPVVFLTAKAQATEQRQLYELGATGVIQKPFDPMQLANQVAELLKASP